MRGADQRPTDDSVSESRILYPALTRRGARASRGGKRCNKDAQSHFSNKDVSEAFSSIKIESVIKTVLSLRNFKIF